MKNKLLKNLKLGICGVGMVGGALKNYFEKKGVKPLVYDKGKNLGSMEEVNKADVIFICVPTPYLKDKGFDLSYIKETCNNIKGEKIIIIKSTVIPGTTEKLQKEYPQHKFLFNPEFLVEERANEDMLNPDRQIVGYTSKSKGVAEEILNLLPKAPFKKVIPASESEMIKYFGNTFLAVKVIFGNQIYELCKKLGIDYDIVREAGSADPRIGPSHLDVFHGGYRGYGGKCLVKDTRALIQKSEETGIDLGLLKKAEEINNQLMKEQKIEDPEKFSKRE